MKYSKEEIKLIEKAYEKIYEIFSRDEFPSNSIEIRHLRKLHGHKILPNGKVRFRLDRLPHSFGGLSLGGPSSAFRTLTSLYELDMNKEEIIEIGRELRELVLDYEQLASEQIQWMDQVTSLWEEDLKEIKNEVWAKQYAIRKFEEYYRKDTAWFDLYDQEGLPEDFESRLLEEIKKQFILKMFDLWEICKADNEDNE